MDLWRSNLTLQYMVHMEYFPPALCNSKQSTWYTWSTFYQLSVTANSLQYMVLSSQNWELYAKRKIGCKITWALSTGSSTILHTGGGWTWGLTSAVLFFFLQQSSFLGTFIQMDSVLNSVVDPDLFDWICIQLNIFSTAYISIVNSLVRLSLLTVLSFRKELFTCWKEKKILSVGG